MLRVFARAQVHPTEDPERVLTALRNLFPDATRIEVRQLPRGDYFAEAEGATLWHLGTLIRALQIPDTARGVMLRGRRGEERTSRFLLGKQAAYMGRVNFGGVDSPLGAVEVRLDADTGDELVQAVYDIAPDTTVAAEWSRVPYDKRPQDLQRKPLAAPVGPEGAPVVVKEAKKVMRADEVETGREGGWETLDEGDLTGEGDEDEA